ncbi:MAG TPA: hypothetical protein VMT87_12350 [Vicinamibacteria bacterium]|nr:hypothetical protein [Vicinamibacteria bacterium]
MKRPACAGPLLALAVALPARAGEVELLPEVSVHLSAARYQPTDPDAHWTGWIGAGAGLARLASATAYFTADVESILGWERRPFEATQANYHLELGVRRPIGSFTAAVFFHHVSRHAVDRDKPEAVDWNVLGVRAGGPLTPSVRLHASIGHTTLASLVGYRWEVTGGVDVDLAPPLYAAGGARWVTVESDPAFARGSFADWRAEAGARLRRDKAVLETFAAFEKRNDVELLTPAVRNRLLLGFRIVHGRPADRDIYSGP